MDTEPIIIEVPEHPVTLSSYTTHSGATGYAVDGPRGHFLVTQNKRGSWEVWRSDSLTVSSTHRDSASAIDAAIRRVSPVEG